MEWGPQPPTMTLVRCVWGGTKPQPPTQTLIRWGMGEITPTPYQPPTLGTKTHLPTLAHNPYHTKVMMRTLTLPQEGGDEDPHPTTRGW